MLRRQFDLQLMEISFPIKTEFSKNGRLAFNEKNLEK
jgi:hypothetical protein